MRATKLINTFDDNTRKVETTYRDAETSHGKAMSKKLETEKDILVALQALSSVQILTQPSQEAQRQLDLRKQEIAYLKGQIQDAETVVGNAVGFTRDAAHKLEATEAELSQRLNTHPTYVQLSEKQTVLKNAVAESQKNEEEIASECSLKLAAFKNNDLYNYLLKVQYGDAANYSRTGVLRLMDGWMANWCNFQENRQNHMTLSAMEQENSSGRDKRLQMIAQTDREIKKFHDDFAAGTNLKELESNLDNANKAEKVAKKKAKDLQIQLDRYNENKDDRYASAVRLMAEQLGEQSIESLSAMAAKTDSKEDDSLVAKIKTLRNKLQEILNSLPGLEADKKDAKEAFARAKEIQVLIASDNRYSSSNYEYKSSLDLDGLIAGFMIGAITNEVLQSKLLDSRVRRLEEPTSSWGGGGGFGGYQSSSSSYPSSSSSSSSDSSSSSSSSSDYSSSSSFGSDSSSSSSSSDYSTSDSF